MRISFDLDDTLIIPGDATPVEDVKYSFITAMRIKEKLRKGTIEIFTALRDAGHEIWIYTTSYRPKSYIKKLFKLHGLKLDGIVNQADHDRQIPKSGLNEKPSKYPPMFGIDLHIDDSRGVGIEAKTFVFNVIVVEPDDKVWIEKIKDYLKL